jgi:hypothetical protein
MSADNGIYILITKGAEGSSEFRVAHAQAIENIEWEKELYGGVWNPFEVWRYFKDCEVFTSHTEANNYAINLLTEIISRFGVCEYGVSLLKFPDQEFPKITDEQYEEYAAG